MPKSASTGRPRRRSSRVLLKGQQTLRRFHFSAASRRQWAGGDAIVVRSDEAGVDGYDVVIDAGGADDFMAALQGDRGDRRRPRSGRDRSRSRRAGRGSASTWTRTRFRSKPASRIARSRGPRDATWARRSSSACWTGGTAAWLAVWSACSCPAEVPPGTQGRRRRTGGRPDDERRAITGARPLDRARLRATRLHDCRDGAHRRARPPRSSGSCRSSRPSNSVNGQPSTPTPNRPRSSALDLPRPRHERLESNAISASSAGGKASAVRSWRVTHRISCPSSGLGSPRSRQAMKCSSTLRSA